MKTMDMKKRNITSISPRTVDGITHIPLTQEAAEALEKLILQNELKKLKQKEATRRFRNKEKKNVRKKR